MATGAPARLLDPDSTAAVLLGASDWTEAGLGRAPSFRRSANGVLNCLIGPGGLGLDPELVLNLFDDPTPAGDQLARVRDTLDGLLRERREAGRPVADLLVYYVGHGSTDEQGHLALLVRRSRQGLEAETGIKAPDLARVLRVAAPQQRRLVVLDCCFAEAAARAFIGMGGALDQAVAATAAKDIAEALPGRGGLLLCSSPVGEVSVGPPETKRTLFTGAVLEVLRDGAVGRPERLSFADLRDAAHERMVESFGAKAPRPVLHPVNQAQGDLSRLPAFPNRAASAAAVHPAPKAEEDRTAATSQAGQASPPPFSFLAASSRPRSAWRWLIVGGAVVALLVALNLSRPQPPATDAAPPPLWATDTATGTATGTDAAPPPAAATALPTTPAEIRALGLSRAREGDRVEAARLYRLAADLGDDWAQTLLGELYEQGRGGLARDDAEAVRLYRLAADQGNAVAQNKLGVLYQQGRSGLPRDDAEAARLYGLAAGQGNAAAQTNLGFYYARGQGGLPRDDAEAVRLFRLAAGQGEATAQANLGAFYEQGRGGLPRDDAEAARLYRLAADQGNAQAQYSLGLLHERGWGGLPRDDAEAARLYRLAADQGNAAAQARLGFFYEEGRGGLPTDRNEAIRAYQKAARAGNAHATQRLTALGSSW